MDMRSPPIFASYASNLDNHAAQAVTDLRYRSFTVKFYSIGAVLLEHGSLYRKN
jgi:hypothetical protein